MFRGHVYVGVEWPAVKLVEFEFRRPDRVKLIRIAWSASKDETGGLELTRIIAFNTWIKPFRKVGFSPVDGTPFRVTTLRGFLCDYGPTVWVLLLAVCSFVLFKFAREAWLVFPCIVTLLGLPLWIWAARKAREWFPPGICVTLRREGQPDELRQPRAGLSDDRHGGWDRNGDAASIDKPDHEN